MLLNIDVSIAKFITNIGWNDLIIRSLIHQVTRVVRHLLKVPTDHFCMDLHGAVHLKWHTVLFGILGTIFYSNMKGHFSSR